MMGIILKAVCDTGGAIGIAVVEVLGNWKFSHSEVGGMDLILGRGTRIDVFRAVR